MLNWRKSSFSETPEGACIEVAWKKSSFSETPDGDCIQVAHDLHSILVRDSKNTAGPCLQVPVEGFLTFLNAVRPSSPNP
jgi:hypothetical protein